MMPPNFGDFNMAGRHLNARHVHRWHRKCHPCPFTAPKRRTPREVFTMAKRSLLKTITRSMVRLAKYAAKEAIKRSVKNLMRKE